MSGFAGFGTTLFGTGSFGTSTGDDSLGDSEVVVVSDALVASVPFRVASVVSLSPTLVKIDFSGFPDPNHMGNFDLVNYSIAGLTISNVDPYGHGKSVILQTSTQSQTLYTAVVNPTPNAVKGLGGDKLDPLLNTGTFQGALAPASFTATLQGRRKIRLQFSEPMNFDARFTARGNYQLVGLDGIGIAITSIGQSGSDNTRGEILLAEDLVPFEIYSLEIGSQVKTVTGRCMFPEDASLEWSERAARRIRVEFDRFSGQAASGPVGARGGVFFSPAFGASTPNSVIEIESVSVCTRAFDVYTVPAIPDPVPLFTFPGPSLGASALLGAMGGVLRASAHRLGQAEMSLGDSRADALGIPVDAAPVGTLAEPIDITRASFLNDGRWRTEPGTGASLGPFRTADNLTSIGTGPTVDAFSVP